MNTYKIHFPDGKIDLVNVDILEKNETQYVFLKQLNNPMDLEIVTTCPKDYLVTKK